MLYWTTPTGRHGRGWNKERQREEERNEIEKAEFAVYD
jgi:hypothetical protein